MQQKARTAAPLAVVLSELVLGSQISQNGRPGGQEAPGVKKLRRFLPSRFSFVCVCVFFQKSVKTAVPEDGNPLGALVFTKLVE